jgi:hypothetical protein
MSSLRRIIITLRRMPRRKPRFMTHETETIVSWVLQLLGSAATGIGSAVLYLNRRLSKMEAQLQEHETKLAVGEKDFKHIERRLDEINGKQDRIIEVLLNQRGNGYE